MQKTNETRKHEGQLIGSELDAIVYEAHVLRSQAFADTFNALFRRNRRA